MFLEIYLVKKADTNHFLSPPEVIYLVYRKVLKIEDQMKNLPNISDSSKKKSNLEEAKNKYSIENTS